MDDIYDILKILLPSIVVFLTAYYFFKKYISHEKMKMEIQIISKNQEIVTPVRLQAYERLVLFLERISPENLIVRANKPSIKPMQLQTDLLESIRAEYEHNISQQVFVSVEAWEMIKKARADVIHLINVTAEKLSDEDNALSFSKKILEATMVNERIPTQDAINFLKKELNQLF